MKQIYNFEKSNPPVLNENMLRQKLEKRKVQHQTMILAAAGILLQVVMLLTGLLSAKSYPVMAVVCFAYVLISAVGSGVIAVMCTRKGGIVL